MIRGSTIELPKEDIHTAKADVGLNIHNRFDIEVIDASTGEVKEKAEAYNIIKNNLWSRLFSKNTWFNYIHYGSGEGVPDPTDPGLFHEIGNGAVGGTTVKSFPAEGYAYCRKSIQLAPTTAVGSTITEVGIGFDAGVSSLCTHAMLQDMNGNPISITKTDTDIINIYATIYLHWNPDGYDNGKIKIVFPSSGTIGNGLLSGLIGLSQIMAGNGMFFSGPPTVIFEADDDWYGNDAPSHGVSMSTNAEAKTITYTVSRINVGNWNFPTGIKSFGFGATLDATLGYYTRSTVYPNIMVLSGGTGMPGSDITGEAVATGDGTTVDFNTKFPFPKNAIVYVDGVPAADVTVEEDSPGSTVSASYFWEYLPEHSGGVHRTRLSADTTPQYCQIHSAGWCTFYNHAYKYGIASYRWNVSGGSDFPTIATLECSDDLVNWYRVPNPSSWGTATIPEEYRYYKYWRTWCNTCSHNESNGPKNNPATFNPAKSYAKNIHFTTPPPEGSVITIDYYTPALAKDSNHVFDMSVTVKLGEYTE